jgi:phosphoribosyl-AMP cyclohydrolase
MALDKKVRISNEFIRSINLVDDQDNEGILKNFILTHSSEKALLSLLEHSSTGKQSAFTWTGPYGSGKSVLALFLAYLSNPGNNCHDKELSKIVSISEEAKLFFSRKRKIIPVVGSSKSIVQCLGEKLKCDCDADSVLNKIKKLAKRPSS